MACSMSTVQAAVAHQALQLGALTWLLQVREEKSCDFIGGGVEQRVAAHNFRVCKPSDLVLALARL